MPEFEQQHAELARLEVENTDNKASPAGHRAGFERRRGLSQEPLPAARALR
jgi:hypothetical protein